VNIHLVEWYKWRNWDAGCLVGLKAKRCAHIASWSTVSVTLSSCFDGWNYATVLDPTQWATTREEDRDFVTAEKAEKRRRVQSFNQLHKTCRTLAKWRWNQTPKTTPIQSATYRTWIITLAACSRERNVTVWRPSVCVTVPPTYSPWLTRGQHMARPAYISADNMENRYTCYERHILWPLRNSWPSCSNFGCPTD